jgi:hypothetical protein
MSKGSNQRPTDLIAYRDNWEMIFGNANQEVVYSFTAADNTLMTRTRGECLEISSNSFNHQIASMEVCGKVLQPFQSLDGVLFRPGDES